jgi:predicted ATP-grasp superfamily ATP-dependent carboligase
MTHPSYNIIHEPHLEEPVLIVALDGWVDAGLGASGAVAAILKDRATETVAVFDGDRFIDQRARRPIVNIHDGVNTGLAWPEISVVSCKDDTGHDLLVMTGPEPDFHWRQFVAGIGDLVSSLSVRTVVGFGAFPAPTPHTRPVRLAATVPESSRELLEGIGSVRGDLEVPAGIMGAVEIGLGAQGVPVITLWARVPHYVAAMSFPEASAVLIEGLEPVAEISIDTAELRSTADAARWQVDELVERNPEHAEMVSNLEHALDASEGNPLGVDEVPTGDELAAELERFLSGEDS